MFYFRNGHCYGTLYYYDKMFDRVTVKSERPLQRCGGAFYNVTTTDDPIIAKVGYFKIKILFKFKIT